MYVSALFRLRGPARTPICHAKATHALQAVAASPAENQFSISSGIGTGLSVRRTVGIEAFHDRN